MRGSSNEDVATALCPEAARSTQPDARYRQHHRRAYNESHAMRFALTLPLLLCLFTSGMRAQQSDKVQPTLTVRSTLVEVPALVKGKGGEIVFALTPGDFVLTDDGIPQHLTLEEDTDSRPLALAIC
jgi:hypothetical protein